MASRALAALLMCVPAGTGLVTACGEGATHTGSARSPATTTTTTTAAAPTGRGASEALDVSRRTGPQAEVRAAIDPHNAKRLVAGSNSGQPDVAMRAYSSGDGGRHFASQPIGRGCGTDASPAIDDAGREHFAFLRFACTVADAPAQVVVATRDRDGGGWRVPRRPISTGPKGADDYHEWLTADAIADSPRRGALYIAWTRLIPHDTTYVLLARSDDGARTWSSPTVVATAGRGEEVSEPVTAVGPGGAVYVAYVDADRSSVSLRIRRSNDGGVRFSRPVELGNAIRPGPTWPICTGAPIPAQPLRCVGSVPTVVVDNARGSDRGRVFVTWSTRLRDGIVVSRLARLSADLRIEPFGAARLREIATPPGGDTFFPAVAVDDSSGTLWACAYTTNAATERREATFGCMASANGGDTFTRWHPVGSASTPHDQAGTGALGLGDFSGLVAASGAALPFWTEFKPDANQEEIYTQRLALPELRAP